MIISYDEFQKHFEDILTVEYLKKVLKVSNKVYHSKNTFVETGTKDEELKNLSKQFGFTDSTGIICYTSLQNRSKNYSYYNVIYISGIDSISKLKDAIRIYKLRAFL